MPKNDRRVRYTKQVIKDSLRDMLRTTPIEQITVKALCEKAEVNRATFYNHYETLSVLMEEVEYETYKSFYDLLSSAIFDETIVTQLVTTTLQYLKEHPNTRGLFLSQTTAGKGLLRFMDELRQQNVLPIRVLSEEDAKKADWTLIFVSSGIREVLRRWFASDMKDEALLIDTLSYFIHTAIRDVFRV